MHPVLFHLGSMEIRSYGVIVCLAFLAVAWLAARRAAMLGLTAGQIAALGGITLAAGVAGARLGFVLSRWNYFHTHGVRIVRFWDGGVGFFGGVALGLPLVAWVLSLYRKPVLRIMDQTIPYLVLAMAITRIGCFLNGCCYGRIADSRWGVLLVNETQPRYPIQLYESAFLFLLFVLLIFLRKRLKPGGVLLVLGLLYGGWRFGSGFLRGDERIGAMGMLSGQWLALAVAVVCGGVLLLRRCIRSSSDSARRKA